VLLLLTTAGSHIIFGINKKAPVVQQKVKSSLYYRIVTSFCMFSTLVFITSSNIDILRPLLIQILLYWLVSFDLVKFKLIEIMHYYTGVPAYSMFFDTKTF
jgi:hypothetical protein